MNLEATQKAAARLTDAADQLTALKQRRDSEIAALDPEKFKPEHIERETARIREHYAERASRVLEEHNVETVRGAADSARAVTAADFIGVLRSPGFDMPSVMMRTSAADLLTILLAAISSGEVGTIAAIRREARYREEQGDTSEELAGLIAGLGAYEPPQVAEAGVLADQVDAAAAAVDAAVAEFGK